MPVMNSTFNYFRWINTREDKHKWYKNLGNNAFSHHAQSGALDKIQAWISSNASNNQYQRAPKRLKLASGQEEELLLLFSTGVSYVSSVIRQGYSYVLDVELYAASKIKWLFKGSMIFLTALKLMSCEVCSSGKKFNPAWKKMEDTCDLMALKVPRTPNVHCFQYSYTHEHVERDKSKAKTRKFQIEMFRKITKIDPERVKIKAIVAINLKWYYLPYFKRVWQDFGPFPFIGCENEGINWGIGNEDFAVGIEDYLSSISGLVIIDDPDHCIRTASLVLSVDDDIDEKIGEFKDLGFSPESSWGFALTGSLRGYNGDDFANEHVPARDELQRRECKLFHSVVGHNFVGAQVEYTFGTNQISDIPCQKLATNSTKVDDMGLAYSPDIQFDDTSTVFLIVGE